MTPAGFLSSDGLVLDHPGADETRTLTRILTMSDMNIPTTSIEEVDVAVGFIIGSTCCSLELEDDEDTESAPAIESSSGEVTSQAAD
jgi:hypothetical protein